MLAPLVSDDNGYCPVYELSGVGCTSANGVSDLTCGENIGVLMSRVEPEKVCLQNEGIIKLSLFFS